MVREGDLVAIYNNIHRVMKAEKILKELKLGILLIPAPRTLQSDCGLAIRYSEPDRKAVEKVMVQEELLPEEIYRKGEGGFARLPALKP
jgi:hypothetical protein